MAEVTFENVIFDSLNANEACFKPAPHKAQVKDACKIEATFHLKGENDVLSVTFVRQSDRFILQRSGNEIVSGKLLGARFSDSDPKFQSLALYTTALQEWTHRNFQNFKKKNPARAGHFYDFYQDYQNFIVNGDIQNPDPVQRQFSVQFLRKTFGLPRQELNYVPGSAKELLKDTKYFHPSMLPRLNWIVSFGEAFVNYKAPLASLPTSNPLHDEVRAWYKDVLIFLGTGHGDLENLKARLVPIVERGIGSLKSTLYFEDLYLHFYKHLEKIQGSPYFQSEPGKSRLKPLMEFLYQSFEDRKAELIFLGKNPGQVQQVFSQSLIVTLIQAARKGELADLVQDDLEKSKLGREWLRNREIVSEIGEALAPAIRIEPKPGGSGRVFIDVELMKSNIAKLLKTHSIRRREFLIGCLAALKFFFGKNFDATSLSAWMNGRFAKVSLELSAQNRREFERFSETMERSVWRSARASENILPWIEGGLALAGGGLIAAGVTTHQRNLSVSGSSVAGFGIGSLVTHFGSHLFLKKRSHNHYLLDSIGGLVGAGAGFGASFFLTQPKPVPIVPPPPPPPPPPDPSRRNPTDTHGP